MFDLASLKKILSPMKWLLSIGQQDTKEVRAQLQDLLQHTTQSLRSFIELGSVLTPIDMAAFGKDTFGPIYVHCQAYLTGPDAAQRARTHCTDIERDVQRINFMMAKYLRTDLGTGGWKGIDTAFNELRDADGKFLEAFSVDLERLGGRLQGIFDKVVSPLADAKLIEEAWREYEAVRTDVIRDHGNLKQELARMREAEDHIRRVLT